MTSYQILTIKATEVQVGDSIKQSSMGSRSVAGITHEDGVVYFTWKDGGYHGYYKESAMLTVLRWDKKGDK